MMTSRENDLLFPSLENVLIYQSIFPLVIHPVILITLPASFFVVRNWVTYCDHGRMQGMVNYFVLFFFSIADKCGFLLYVSKNRVQTWELVRFAGIHRCAG